MAEDRKFVTPPLAQIGIVVKDLEKAKEFYSKVLGIGPFETIIFQPEKHWLRGKPCPIKLKIAGAHMGPVQIELIEPLSDGPHKWFLDNKGEGLQHIAFHVDDYDGWIDHLTKHGMKILMNAEVERPKGYVRPVAYLESEDSGGVLIEIGKPPPP